MQEIFISGYPPIIVKNLSNFVENNVNRKDCEGGFRSVLNLPGPMIGAVHGARVVAMLKYKCRYCPIENFGIALFDGANKMQINKRKTTIQPDWPRTLSMCNKLTQY